MANVLFISTTTGYAWPGSEELWYRAALGILHSDSRVAAWVHRDIARSTQIADLRSEGGDVAAWRTPSLLDLAAYRARLFTPFPRSLLDRFDTVVVSTGSLPSLAYPHGLLPALLATKADVVILCQFNAEQLVISRDERARIASLLSKARKVVFVSEHNRDTASRQFGIDFSAQPVISNPIRFTTDTYFGWPRSEVPHFANVARMETGWKCQDVLLDILRRPEWLARSWKMTFFGEGPDRSHLEHLTKSYGLADRVEFAGYVAAAGDIWRDQHILLLPSRGEGRPLALLEAMMASRPAVVTDVGGIAETIQDGVNGWVAESASPSSYAAAMERAWNDRSRWQEMGMAGHRRIKEIAADGAVYDLMDIIIRAKSHVT
jgi:glycosyltransferase involved in cell wall biosynthesis